MSYCKAYTKHSSKVPLPLFNGWLCIQIRSVHYYICWMYTCICIPWSLNNYNMWIHGLFDINLNQLYRNRCRSIWAQSDFQISISWLRYSCLQNHGGLLNVQHVLVGPQPPPSHRGSSAYHNNFRGVQFLRKIDYITTKMKWVRLYSA